MKWISAILFFALAAFNLAPPTVPPSTAEKTDCCSGKDHAHKAGKGSADCSGTDCARMICCGYGNYIPAVTENFSSKPGIPRQRKIYIYNDHRLSSVSSGCWHPPKFMSA